MTSWQKVSTLLILTRCVPRRITHTGRVFCGNTGSTFDEVLNEANRLARVSSRRLVHPFDDWNVIVGQATVAAEIIRQIGSKDLDTVFCFAGGGGLLSAVATFVKHVRPNVEVVGVETEDASPLAVSLRYGMRTTLNQVGTWLDEAPPAFIGRRNYSLCRDHVDRVITVTNDDVCAAVKDAFDETRSLIDPMGAVSIAGLKIYARERIERDAASSRVPTLCAITTGANFEFNRLRGLAERADDSERFLAVTIPERPGSFRTLYEQLYPRNGNFIAHILFVSPRRRLHSDVRVNSSILTRSQ